jgi:Na+-transporting NADH:ubiquinone oxidoreductase subunit F
MKLLTLRKLHKWVALFVGIQLLLWTLSGLMFAWLDHHEVAGEHLTESPENGMLKPEVHLADPAGWLGEYAGLAIQEVTLRQLDGTWVYRVTHERGVDLRRAADGRAFVIDPAVARRLAVGHYAGDGRLVEIRHHAASTIETRGAGATWEARFDDEPGTSLYFSARDGALVQTRTDRWRIFDFFWMLHTMDYVGRDNFNNPLVILAGSSALWVALTGVLLLFRVFRWKFPIGRSTSSAAQP